MCPVKKNLVQLTEQDAAAISRSLLAYADAAYPPGGSECAQSSHQAVCDLAAVIGQSHRQAILIKKRQLPTIKAALNWYFSPESKLSDIPQGHDAQYFISQLTSS